MKKLNEKEIKAMEEVITICGYDIEGDIVERFYEDDIVTLNTGRDGKEYAWYSDENKNVAISVDTLEELTEEEIEEQFF